MRVSDCLTLMGDEDCGVGLHCRESWDGGRPLAYYSLDERDRTYEGDPKVERVSTLADLMSCIVRHNH